MGRRKTPNSHRSVCILIQSNKDTNTDKKKVYTHIHTQTHKCVSLTQTPRHQANPEGGASLTVLDHADEGDNGQQDDIAHGFLVHGCFGFRAGPLSSLAPHTRTVREGEVGAGLCLSSLAFPKVPAQLQAFFFLFFFFLN